VVLAGWPFGNDDLSYVEADNVSAARTAVQYLLKHGRGTVAGPLGISPAWTGCAAGPVHVVLDAELVIREAA